MTVHGETEQTIDECMKLFLIKVPVDIYPEHKDYKLWGHALDHKVSQLGKLRASDLRRLCLCKSISEKLISMVYICT